VFSGRIPCISAIIIPPLIGSFFVPSSITVVSSRSNLHENLPLLAFLSLAHSSGSTFLACFCHRLLLSPLHSKPLLFR
jgi:hypothetical protein